MHIRKLIARTGIPERQVRYLIAEGFMPAPRGGRANADYGEDHVQAIERFRHLRELGFPPAAIRLLLQTGEGAPFPVEPGVTLIVDPTLIGTGKPVDPIIARLRSLLEDLFGESASAESKHHYDAATMPSRGA